MNQHYHYDEAQIKAMHDQGMTQHAIAVELGVSQSTLSHKMASYGWFKGKLGKEMCTCCKIRRRKKGHRFLCIECHRENGE